VLRPGGRFVVTYLPNRWSYEEWVLRHVRQAGYHRRLYGLGGAKDMLRHAGFVPLHAGPQSFLWERRLGGLAARRWGRAAVAALKAVMPVHRACSTLCLVAEKVVFM
jgi:hypothetical protein